MRTTQPMAGRAVGTDPDAERAAILGQALEYLHWLKDEGLSHVEVSQAVGGKAGGTTMPVATQVSAPVRNSLRPALDGGNGRAPQGFGRQAQATTQATAPVRGQATAPDTVAVGRDLAAIAGEIAGCNKCGLHKTRTKTVPGQGTPCPEIMFVGEAPGADEDAQGLAFVGAAGQLLTKMIEAMGLTRDEVFIANILKCRPPDNRKPTPEEMVTCIPYLKEQIRLLKPKVIVALGATAVNGLLGDGPGITKLRGQWRVFEGIDVMPTFHPAYLLRNPATKREAWDDLKAVLRHVGRTPPAAPKKQG